MRVLLVPLLFLLLIPVAAIDENTAPILDESRYPTLVQLAENPQPPADRFDLARRFLGVTELPPHPTSAPQWSIGDRSTYYISVTESGEVEQIEAELLAAGKSVLVWGEVNTGMTNEQAQGFARRFDAEIYQPTRALWGSEAIPGIDGDPRIYAVFTRRVNRGVLAYFSGQNTLSAVVQPYSNEHEMMVFNLNAISGALDTDTVMSVAAHEFQHMINRYVDVNEEGWLDEGLSMFTEYWLSLADVNWALRAALNNPANQLTLWGIEGDVSGDYGTVLLFLIYLYEQHSLELMQQVAAAEADGLAAVDAVLRANGESGADAFFADWALANVLQLPDGRHGYRTIQNLPAAPTMPIFSLPYTRSALLSQYASEYYALRVVPESGELRLNLTLPEDAALIPTNAVSGQRMWYSGRGDDSNPRLTRAFDLRGVTTAELVYQIWYALERDWDYGYLSISEDGGQTWQIQPTALTTTNDPNRKLYGAGYTGNSDGWQQERITLDAFAGREILVRFEVVSDDSTHQAGMALDDLRVDAIGYQADLELDDGGWLSDGWLLTDNRVPQQAWLQVAQQIGGEVELSRWLVHGSGTFTLTVNPAAERVIFALSPFAPLTAEPTSFFLEVYGE